MGSSLCSSWAVCRKAEKLVISENNLFGGGVFAVSVIRRYMWNLELVKT